MMMIEMTIFDLSGDKEYGVAVQDYMNSIQILLLCYSVVERESVEEAERLVMKIQKSGMKDIIGVVVGCKKDLVKIAVSDCYIHRNKTIVHRVNR